MAATNLRDERVDQMVVLEGPGELSPFVAALAGPTVDFVAEKIGEACIAAGPDLLAHPQQQETAVAWAADLEFFFSSRRRHTKSVSAFLLNRSSDLLIEAKAVWKRTDCSVT